jgi:hypothetical protein
MIQSQAMAESLACSRYDLSPHSSAVHYAGLNHRSITDNCWTSYWSKQWQSRWHVPDMTWFALTDN